MHFKNNRGVAGADVAVALTIFIVFISLISSLFLNTVTTSRKVERKSIATNAAVQLIENYKQKSIAELVELTKDENATQNDNGSNELTIKDEDIDKSILGIPELYKEAYKISAKLENYKNEDKVIKFTSIVEYKSGKNDEKIQIETLITKNKNNDELAKLKNIKDINIKRMTLDGASLITVTLEDDSIATSNDVKWRSSDEEVATVTPNGIVMCGEKYGTAIITCIGANGSAQCEVSSEDTKARIIYKNTNDYNCTITGSTTMRGYNNPTIPSGFYAIDTQDAKWVRADTQVDYNKGLVIMDEKGNQFVWVPIDGTTVAYEKWCTNGISYANCIDDIFPYTDTSKYYGGFWIGRYEAGLDVDFGSIIQNTASDNGIRNITGNPLIVEGSIPWNFIDFNKAKTNAQNLYQSSNTNVQSGLVNGTQWDTTMKWLQEIEPKYNVSTDSILFGNYKNNSLTLDRYKNIGTGYGSDWNNNAETTSSNTSQLIRTGASTSTKTHNISDIAGNLWEWTDEIYKNSDNRIIRGAGFAYESDSNPASKRYFRENDNQGHYRRFSCSIIFKV